MRARAVLECHVVGWGMGDGGVSFYTRRTRTLTRRSTCTIQVVLTLAIVVAVFETEATVMWNVVGSAEGAVA